MPGKARNNDTAGGAIIATATSVFVNGRPVARVGDGVVGHGKGQHGGATILRGSLTVFAEGQAVARLLDPANCGHTISTASEDVNAN